MIFFEKGIYLVTELMRSNRGRPKKGTAKKPPRIRRDKVGRPSGREPRENQGYDTMRIGVAYVRLLNKISIKEERNKSGIVRDCIDRLRLYFVAGGFNLPPAVFDGEEAPFIAAKIGEPTGDMTTFTMGAAHKELLSRMGQIRNRSNWRSQPGENLGAGGKTQLLRDEIDRYAAEHGFTPVAPPVDGRTNCFVRQATDANSGLPDNGAVQNI